MTRLFAYVALLALAGCANEGSPSITVNCTSASQNRDCGSIAVSITSAGPQTVTPQTTVTIPVSAAPGGLGALADPAVPPSVSVTH